MTKPCPWDQDYEMPLDGDDCYYITPLPYIPNEAKKRKGIDGMYKSNLYSQTILV